MKKLAIFCAVSGIALGAATSAGLAYERVYTDLDECREVPGIIDEFKLYCKGPDGVVGVLYYFDGRVFPIYGEEGGWFGDDVSGTPYNQDDEPLMVGLQPEAFDPKIEWTLAEGGRPCAAIVRVATEEGSRLVVTSLGGGGRVGVVSTNEAAQAMADNACAEFGPAPAPRPFNELAILPENISKTVDNSDVRKQFGSFHQLCSIWWSPGD